ncbi:PAC2 family protein [Austwickia chelonae]|uniref:PAC2 family protein n=1 Tax=Austwickia chelonae TaxID=100225 RepID=UPI000E22DF02|nr:PAC2 family protein [Austwickia chelonae]
MIDFDDVPELRSPVVLAAFEGWNDAAEAASSVIGHLAQQWEATGVAGLDPEEYYDLQVNRPRITRAEGVRQIVWPGTAVLVATPPELEHDIVLIDGVEPSMRWRTFSAELVDFMEEVGAQSLFSLGALLAESPHRRPLPVTVASENADLRERFDLPRSTYEGPTGIVGILGDAAAAQGIPSASLWVSVPHYAAAPPAPKATWALIRKLEELLSCTLPHGDLTEASRSWEENIDQLVEGDEDVTRYVRHLETSADAADSLAASGDAIARDFERYLRGRGGQES